MSKYEISLKVPCSRCRAAAGKPCIWTYGGEPDVFHLRRYLDTSTRSVWPLHIYLPQTRAWECHRCGSIELRDSLRAVWRSAGHATAVEL